MHHSQRFKIVGFFDRYHKWWGREQIIFFKPDDALVLQHIPLESQLLEYVTMKGYKEKGWTIDPNKAIPVYEVVGMGLDYLFCTECWHGSKVIIDNRKAPG